jgi:uncharacterized protein (DUF302 family)
MSTKEFSVERFSLLSKKSFQDVLTSIEAQIGHPDIGKLFEDIARSKTDEELKAIVNDAVGPTDLMEFVRFDQGQVLRRELGDEAPQVLRLLVGNPLTMRKMVKFVHDAGSYAPVTILIDERSDRVLVSYDRMASLIAPYGSAEALQVAKDLDSTVENILRNAAL